MKTVAAKRPARRVVALGQYIVSDSAICHGAVTFKGTRCLVADALELLAEGLAPREVCAQMHGWIEPAAVLEAVRLAKDHFLDRHSKLRVARRKAAQRARGSYELSEATNLTLLAGFEAQMLT